jgi:hypothetical protein
MDTTGNVIRETLVCPNVVSFHVQVMPLGSPAFGDVQPQIVGGVNQSFGIYDTTQFNNPSYANNRFGIKGIQITLRLWDNKTRQTRQMTVIQDL